MKLQYYSKMHQISKTARVTEIQEAIFTKWTLQTKENTKFNVYKTYVVSTKAGRANEDNSRDRTECVYYTHSSTMVAQ